MGLWLKQDDGTLVEVSGGGGGEGGTGADGADGVDGKGWTGGSYDPTTGTVTFTSDDGLEFTTGDLRGANGIDGLAGVDGNEWHVGSGDPAPTLGDPGDYYLDGDAGWVWVKRTDTSWTNLYVNLTGPPGEGAGEHDHDYLPLSGGTLTGDLQVEGTATAALFSIPTNDAANATMKTYTANGYQLMQLQVSTANTIEIAGPDSSQRPNTVSISSGGGVAARFDPNQDTRLYGDLQVDGQLIVPSKKAIRTGSPTSVPDDRDYGLAVGNASSNKGALAVSADNVATRYAIELWNPNGIVGRIVTVNSTTRYEVDANRTPVSLASATDIPDALGTLEALRFRRFTDDDGVDAATAHKVYPFAVSAGMDSENPDYGVDYGRFTPLLGAALLELTAEVKELSARIEELEGN